MTDVTQKDLKAVLALNTLTIEKVRQSVVEDLKEQEEKIEELDNKVSNFSVLVGPKGDKGDPGKDGRDGRDGRDGLDGEDGKDGKDGKDGENISPELVDELFNELTKVKNEVKEKSRPVGWGAHPLVIQGSGTTVDKITRTINFTGATVSRSPSGVVTVAIGSFQTPTSGTVDGSNAVFVWATAPNVIVVDQGRMMQQTSSDGTVNWTGTTTTTLTVPPNFDIYSIA